jgi:ferritin
MNPPFTSKSAYLQNAPAELQNSGMKIGYYMLQKSMEMSNHVIAIMPWFTLSDSDVRLRFLKAYGIKSLTALPRKTFEYVRIQTVIIELLKDYKEETIFKTFNF